MTKILLLGATGGIGRHAMQHALDRGYEVVAYVRNPSHITLQHENLKVMLGTLADEPALTQALQGVDAVVWCVGVPMMPRGNHQAAISGHEVLLRAMKANGVRRLVDWGTPTLRSPEDLPAFITTFPNIRATLFMPKAKQELLTIGAMIQSSDTDWTIVRFLKPTDAPFSGKVATSFGDKKIHSAISRSDIAWFMINEVEDTEFIKRMPIIGGAK